MSLFSHIEQNQLHPSVHFPGLPGLGLPKPYKRFVATMEHLSIASPKGAPLLPLCGCQMSDISNPDLKWFGENIGQEKQWKHTCPNVSKCVQENCDKRLLFGAPCRQQCRLGRPSYSQHSPWRAERKSPAWAQCNLIALMFQNVPIPTYIHIRYRTVPTVCQIFLGRDDPSSVYHVAYLT